MKKIGIIVGEDADLPRDVIKKNNILTFSFVLDWNKYKKGSNIYKLMRSTIKGGPKTSQPSVAAFSKVYEEGLSKYDDIIIICVSSRFSGTYNSATQARKMSKRSENIHLIDSESSSGAEGLLVLKAIELVGRNDNVKNICNDLKKYVSRINLVGSFEDPKWLVAGGRVSKIKGMLVKNMLKSGFRPILTIRDGEIVVKKIQINSKDPVDALFSQFKGDCHDKNVDIVITHADSKNKAENLAKLLVKISKSIKIKYINEISPVVGCHLGPDTILLSWVAV